MGMAELKSESILSTDVEWIENRDEWVGLNAIGMVRSIRVVDETESVENRYFITSLTDVQLFSEAARKHWEIENNLH